MNWNDIKWHYMICNDIKRYEMCWSLSLPVIASRIPKPFTKRLNFWDRLLRFSRLKAVKDHPITSPLLQQLETWMMFSYIWIIYDHLQKSCPKTNSERNKEKQQNKDSSAKRHDVSLELLWQELRPLFDRHCPRSPPAFQPGAVAA